MEKIGGVVLLISRRYDIIVLMNKTTSKKYLADLLLFVTAVLWGSGFYCQKIGAETTSPFCFCFFRYISAAVFVTIAAKFRLPFREPKMFWHTVLTGLMIYLGGLLQQLGMQSISIGNSSFITAAYIVIVPFLAWILFRRRIHPRHWLAAGITLVGLYLLSTGGKGFSRITSGDLVVFAGSFCWAMHILCVQKGVKMYRDVVAYTAGQFIVASVLYFVTWLVIDRGSLTGLNVSWPYAVLSGVFTVGLGFILQGIGQKHTGETEASIILGLESVFGALFGVILYHETFSPLQIFGMVLIFIAVILAVTVKPDKEETVNRQ